MNTENLTKIFDEIATVYHNLSAEVLITEIQEKVNLSEKHFLIKNNGTFSRPYRRDVISVDNNYDKNWLTFNLSRDSLYDLLPEGLFHTRNTNKTSFAAHRKQQKEEEKNARLFFTPLENEFFFQKLEIEKNERTILQDLNNLKSDFLLDFWNINKDIPKHLALKLINILPLSYKIAGDMELTRLSLEQILGVNVAFKKKFRTINNDKKKQEKLNEDRLGVDTVLKNDDMPVLTPYIEVEIGPIDKTSIDDYLKKNSILAFANEFYSYFMPFEVQVETKLFVDNKDGFLLNNKGNTIIGVSTKI